MKPIFWVLLGILAVVVLFFGAAFITGIIEAIRGENPARGDISYPDHELYAEAKEKYIKKKSQ